MIFTQATGSYVPVTNDMYQPPPAGTPGWELAPVPGWGTNPARSGPPVLAMNGMVPAREIISDWSPIRPCSTCPTSRGLSGDSEDEANQGYIALAAAGGIFLGGMLVWIYFANKKK